MMTPERSLEQRLAALLDANNVRHSRKELKLELKEGRKSVIDVLVRPPDYIRTMKAFDLLRSVPSYGRVKTNNTLARCKMSPSKTVGGMTSRQRFELCACIARARGARIGPHAESAERFLAQMRASVHEAERVGVG